MDTHTAVVELLGIMFFMQSHLRLYKEDQWDQSEMCGGRSEYLHHSPWVIWIIERTTPKGKLDHTVPGNINRGTGPSRLGQSWIWNHKVWLYYPVLSNGGSDSRMTALVRVNSNCKWEIHPLITDRAPYLSDSNKIYGHGPQTGLDTKIERPNETWSQLAAVVSSLWGSHHIQRGCQQGSRTMSIVWSNYPAMYEDRCLNVWSSEWQCVFIHTSVKPLQLPVVMR
jgi:hypothetical protein